MKASSFYRFVYAIGVKPWEAESEGMATQLESLIEREEVSRQRPYGSALDLGCGSGRWSVVLASRGWQVAGVDAVRKAVRAAQRRAEEERVDVRFVEGDVTALSEAGVGAGFEFFLDVECFNHLSDRDRAAMGREVSAVASADATLLMLVWARARRGPFPPGASRQDLEAAFPGWRIVAEDRYQGELPAPLKRIDPRWYRLSHSS
jgi:SAM-dependent methyltransferase